MIKIDNLTKKYGDAVILENTSYTFPKTGLVCLMGASGGGKTTLLNLLAGFDTDYEGELLAGGASLNQMTEAQLCEYRRDNVGFVFQSYHLLPGYTVLENVMLSSALTGETPQTSLEKALALLARLDIGQKETQKVENLSGGQKQRVAIARALMGNPQILFADEPTGALDRVTSTEIMELLREISRERLVVVITHDQKICDFADEVIHIQNKKIVGETPVARGTGVPLPLKNSGTTKVSGFSRGAKNFRVHLKRYLAVSLAISIGALAFLFSLSFGNVMDKSILDFQEKNTAFNNGYIKGADSGEILDYLNEDSRLENVYYQYKLGEISLTANGKTELMAEKFPTAKATESLSYGVMPRRGMNEVSLTPSLAKKFDTNIKNLLGKELSLLLHGQEYKLIVSGIYNAGYDDFFVSSDVEQLFYAGLEGKSNYSISYDVGEFSDIVAVSNSLKLGGLDSKNVSDEVFALQSTFQSLSRLFLIISILILAIGLFICSMLLFKLQNTRYHEVGLLSALGFSRHQISSMFSVENLLLSTLAAGVNFVLLGLSTAVSHLLSLPLIISGTQIALSVLAIFVLVTLLSRLASYKLVRTEPAVALKK